MQDFRENVSKGWDALATKTKPIKIQEPKISAETESKIDKTIKDMRKRGRSDREIKRYILRTYKVQLNFTK